MFIMSTFKKGFTLIELLVVIAIIGVLSSVVLGAVNTGRGKAANAAVKSDLNNVRSQAELIYDQNNGIYGPGLCTDQKVTAGLGHASTVATGAIGNSECNSDNLSWAAQSPFKVPDASGNTYWCIDNGGAAKGETAVLGTALACP
jgi:prepilin-type N-terminal cleavage/methylation domain-containing protein